SDILAQKGEEGFVVSDGAWPVYGDYSRCTQIAKPCRFIEGKALGQPKQTAPGEIVASAVGVDDRSGGRDAGYMTNARCIEEPCPIFPGCNRSHGEAAAQN